jgi:hypothetical protein
MWPFDRLKQLFGQPPSASGPADGFEARLAEFVREERDRAAEPQAQRQRTGSKEMIDAARRTVDSIAGAFQAYVNDRVLRKFGQDFKVDVPTDARTRDLDTLFAEVKTGNEYRYVEVSFRGRWSVCLRVQAVILSRDVQLRGLFLENKKGGVTHATEVDLSAWPSLTDVKWEQVFEKLFLEFLDWHRVTVAKAGS